MALQYLPAIVRLHLQNMTSAAEAGKYVTVLPEVGANAFYQNLKCRI